VAATNGRKVFYNSDVLNEWPMGDVVFVALHEIMHNMLCHLVRFGDRDKQIAGIAMDIVGNNILRKMCGELPNLKMTVPASACLPNCSTCHLT
jgi:predicted metal-dependent peptidase